MTEALQGRTDAGRLRASVRTDYEGLATDTDPADIDQLLAAADALDDQLCGVLFNGVSSTTVGRSRPANVPVHFSIWEA